MKKPVLFFIMAIILISVVGVASFAQAQDDDLSIVAENMLKAVKISSGEVNAQFENYAVNNTVTDDAAEALVKAESLFVRAQAAYDSGGYQTTIELANEALNEYGNAAALLTPVMMSEFEVEKEVESTYRKLGGYDRAFERLEKLFQLAYDLETQGVDVLESTDLLDEAKSILDVLGTAIDQGNLEDMEDMVDQANSLMGQATGLLQKNSGEKRVEKTEWFIIQTRLHVRKLETKLNRILAKYNLNSDEDESIMLQFQDLNDYLNIIEPTLENLKDVTHQLQLVVKESHQIGKSEGEVEDDLVDQINEVNEKETKLNRYRERLEELALLGYDTSEAEDLLDQAEELLGSSMDMLEVFENEEANYYLDQAESILNQVDDLLDDMENNMKHESEGESDSFDKKVAELLRKISRYRIEVQNLAKKGQNIDEFEAQLDVLEQSLNQAQTRDDLDVIESHLESFGNQLNANTSGS